MRLFQKDETAAAKRDLFVQMVDENDFVTPVTGLSLTVQIAKAGGSAYAGIAGSSSEISAGTYKISLAAADLDTEGGGILKITASGAATQFVPIRVVVHQADLDTILARVQALGTAAITSQTPVLQTGDWEIFGGDDHTGAAVITRTRTNYSGHDPNTATPRFILKATTEYAAGTGDTVLDKELGAATVTNEADGSVTVSVEIALTGAETAALSPRPPADRFAYTYQLCLEAPGGERTTLERGRVTVFARVD